VNETRARVYLSQGRNAAAERVAFAAVTTLQHGGEQSLLAEALITHGLTLARLGKSGPALRSFRQAVSVGDSSGDLRSSASALLMMIEELHGSIDNSEVVQAFLEADRKLASTLDSETAERFRSCSRIVANLALNASTAFEEHLIGGTMDEELRHFEAQLIKCALDQENGSITRAARSLGISHQGLTYLIENRHVGLSSARNPPRRRNKPSMKH
jgi:hypothetical protein